MGLDRRPFFRNPTGRRDDESAFGSKLRPPVFARTQPGWDAGHAVAPMRAGSVSPDKIPALARFTKIEWPSSSLKTISPRENNDNPLKCRIAWLRKNEHLE